MISISYFEVVELDMLLGPNWLLDRGHTKARLLKDRFSRPYRPLSLSVCLTGLNISSARSLHSAEHLNPEFTLLAPEPRPMPIPNSLPRSYPASIAAIDADMYISTENHTTCELATRKR